jgi:transcriptional regulator with XRE-family HTH domain
MDSEMKVNARLVRRLREDRAWSQDHLATAAGLSLRTVQRIESEGNASPESRLAIAAALKIDAATLLSTDSDSGNATRSGSDNDLRSRPRLGLVLGIVSGFIGATIGVASAWMAATQGAHSSAELGMSHALLGTFYGLTCAALATAWDRFRQHE